MDQRTVRKLEHEIEETVAQVILGNQHQTIIAIDLLFRKPRSKNCGNA